MIGAQMEKTDKTSAWRKLKAWISRHPQNEPDFRNTLNKARESGIIDDDALHMIEGVLRVSERQVRDAMLPRGQMQVIDANATIAEAIPKIIDSRHSRFPVIAESRDEVVGIMLAKDLLKIVAQQDDRQQTIVSLIRPATIIPESKRLDSLLQEFRHKRNHMAIVVDEYGGVSGLITIEDVLEQIVGSIADEYDVKADIPPIQEIDTHNFIVDALTPIEDFNKHFNCNINAELGETINGVIIKLAAKVPQAGYTTKIEGLQIKINSANQRRILKINVSKQTANND